MGTAEYERNHKHEGTHKIRKLCLFLCHNNKDANRAGLHDDNSPRKKGGGGRPGPTWDPRRLLGVATSLKQEST